MAFQYALVDCNNFYVSCERVFNPKLNGKPVIILSNNDGCAISRSQEAKKLGVAMGVPYFKIKSLCDQHNIHVLSSNYELYGDLSERIMKILGQFTKDFEVYSIDEAFLKFSTHSPSNMKETAYQIKKTIFKWTGIPISIGIGPNKTLAKVANHFSKKADGVFILKNPSHIDETLANLPVEDIWGIGRQNSRKLIQHNIKTALDMKKAPSKKIRKFFTVTGEKTWAELNSFDCIGLEEVTEKKVIQYSRSFGGVITKQEDMLNALQNYVERAFEKLRGYDRLTHHVRVYFRTSRWEQRKTYVQKYISLPYPTDNTMLILKILRDVVENMFQEGFRYKKAGVTLTGLEPAVFKKDLFNIPSGPNKLMQEIDRLNKKFGKKTVTFGNHLIHKEWAMLSNYKTKCFTTSWRDIPIVT